MTAQLHFEPLSHSYWYEDQQVPSVTTIIRILTEYGRMSEKMLAPYARRGTEVHSLTEAYDLDPDFDPDTVEPERAGFLMAWVNFRNDFDFVPTHIEERVFHPKLLYAGTADRFGVLRGEMSVIDIKTSAKLGPAVGVQLAAYQHAFNDADLGVFGQKRGTEEEIRGRYAVQLKADGTYLVKQYDNPLDWDAFRGCLALHTWQQDHRFVLPDVRPRVAGPEGDDPEDANTSAWPAFRRDNVTKDLK